MKASTSFIPFLMLCLASSHGFEMGADFIVEILQFPLKNNPFFAKVAYLGADMNTDGILVNDTDMSSNSCNVIGDLECEDGEHPVCSGIPLSSS